MQAAKSAPDLACNISEDVVLRNSLSKSSPLDKGGHEEERAKIVSIVEPHQIVHSNRSGELANSTPSTNGAGSVHGSSDGVSLSRRDDREQRADWLDIIHFYLHRNIDKIRTSMHTPELLVKTLECLEDLPQVTDRLSSSRMIYGI